MSPQLKSGSGKIFNNISPKTKFSRTKKSENMGMGLLLLWNFPCITNIHS